MKRLFCLILFFSVCHGRSGHEDLADQQIKKGNLVLSTSQQPAPLFSIGQNIISKNELQIFIYGDWLYGNKLKYEEMLVQFLYGINDDCSLFFTIPIATKFKLNNFHSAGIEDLTLQFEYAYHSSYEPTYLNQATVIANMSFPTGSAQKVPYTGLGSPSFFLGGTYSHLAIDLYYYLSGGVVLTTKRHGTKIGNQILYEGGIGYNLHHMDEWIFLAMLEMNGLYVQKPQFNNLIDQNSGGNVIYLGPSLWLSNSKFIFQVGISGVPYQKLFGVQPKQHYFAAFDIIYKFN